MKKKRMVVKQGEGKLGGETLTKMRDIAFGRGAVQQIEQTLNKPRNDEAAIKAAQEKRQRRAERIRKTMGLS